MMLSRSEVRNMINKENNDELYWDLVITLEEKKQEIESQLPNVTETIFEEYVMLTNILGPLYSYLTK